MASQTDVVNRALSKIGEPRISAIDNSTKVGRIMGGAWDVVRDKELRVRRWNFAIARASLAALTTAPVFGFAYEYQLPSDFLCLLDIDGAWFASGLSDYRNSEEVPFRIEGRKILTDLGAPLLIRYMSRVEDVGSWDAAFVDVMACAMAVECVEEITQSNTKKQLLQQDYKEAVRMATRANAIENPPQPLPDDSWVLSRL